MNLNKLNINEFLNRYINFVDSISIKYSYDSNIKHVLYIIVPAFVLKYGIKNERKILDLFEDIKVLINTKEDNYNVAKFERKIIKDNNNYILDKKIVLNKYNHVSVVELIDSIIHEFNHAINSINNEMVIDSKYICLRSGIVNTKYDKETLNIIDEDENYIMLEEILNTSQTEEIINNILSLYTYIDSIENATFINMLYSLYNEVGTTYKSKAYFLQNFMSQELMENKTFTSTLNNLRFSGDISDVNSWFDNIIGEDNSFNDLCRKLTKTQQLELEYMRKKYFKNRILSKIRINFKDISEIIERFNETTFFK